MTATGSAPYPIPRDAVAPCMREDPERFFPKKGNNGSVLDATRNVCRGEAGRPACPFLSGCLAYGLTHKVEGVWGGKTDDERKKLRKKYGIKAEHLSLAGLVPTGPGTRSLAPHGTPGAIAAHSRRHESLCDECRAEAKKRRQAAAARRKSA